MHCAERLDKRQFVCWKWVTRPTLPTTVAGDIAANGLLHSASTVCVHTAGDVWAEAGLKARYRSAHGTAMG